MKQTTKISGRKLLSAMDNFLWANSTAGNHRKSRQKSKVVFTRRAEKRIRRAPIEDDDYDEDTAGMDYIQDMLDSF